MLKTLILLRDAAIQVNKLTNAWSSVHFCMGWIGGRSDIYIELSIAFYYRVLIECSIMVYKSADGIACYLAK